MEDLEDVRRRMRQKKGQEPVLSNRLFEKFYRFAIGTMTLCLVFLMVSCFLKVNPTFDWKNFIDEHILTILPSFNVQSAQEVTQPIVYEQLASHTFKGNDEHIYALDDGIIQKVTDEQLIVLYRNGITATYTNFATSHVKTLDRIVMNESIGTYEQSFDMHLSKNGQEMAYEELYA